MAIRTLIKRIPFLYKPYLSLRSAYQTSRIRSQAKAVFENPEALIDALHSKQAGSIELKTLNGLTLSLRNNIWDARIVKEIYLDKPYVKHARLGPDPIVLDIGGYIGDFSLYAAKYLGASRVIVYEPTDENFQMLRRNVTLNGLEEVITIVNKAVGTDQDVLLNVEIGENEEVHASAYWYEGADDRRAVPSDNIVDIFRIHDIPHIDLMKVDCEGGEYDILPGADDAFYARVKNIVFEYHPFDGYEPKLERVLARLREAGYTLIMEKGCLIHALRD